MKKVGFHIIAKTSLFDAKSNHSLKVLIRLLKLNKLINEILLYYLQPFFPKIQNLINKIVRFVMVNRSLVEDAGSWRHTR